MTRRSPFARRLVRSLFAAAMALAGGHAMAAWPDAPPRRMPWDPPEKRPLPLRLDEAPELPLLRPFRDPKGPPATAYATYRAGPWGLWRERLWYPLTTSVDARVTAPSNAPPKELAAEPVSPPVLRDLAVDAWLARRGESAQSFPFRADGERAHWFVREEQAPTLALGDGTLAVDERWVPPWLRRLDPSWAGELLGVAGCGRGGTCSTESPFPGEAFFEVWSALVPRALPIPAAQCRERPTTIGRFGGEHASFVLLRCDGSIGDRALERLSILARPQNVAAPEVLPDEPDPRAANGEWVPGIHLIDPRLVWVLARVAEHFPGKAIYLYSGYRPTTRAEVVGMDGFLGENSQHGSGRALDISVDGVPNEELLAWVFELPDTGCGYYPRSRFVHVDVRPRSSGSSVWIDGSSPGERSVYFPEWPGVVEKGRVVWKKTASAGAGG